jgi:LysM repeat protein
MPAEIKAEVTGRRNRKRKIIIGSLVGILLVIAALFILTQSGKGIFLSTKAPVAVQNTAVMTSIPVPVTATSLPTATATEVEPTLTSTPVQPHILETPFGVENKLIIHQLLDGESLIVLAKKYNTSVDAIKAVNQENMTLWAKTLIVIPVDQTDVSSSQRFKVILLNEKGMSIQDLAVQYSVDAQLLAQVNHVPETYSFQKGEWVLIPIAQKTP